MTNVESALLLCESTPTCDWASQNYKRRLTVVSSSGADAKTCDQLLLTRTTLVQIRLLANFFFLPFQISHQKSIYFP